MNRCDFCNKKSSNCATLILPKVREAKTTKYSDNSVEVVGKSIYCTHKLACLECQEKISNRLGELNE